MQDLGWKNGWRETPEIVEKCEALHHETSDVDMGPPYRGLDHVVTCRICGYQYHYDSSD